MTLNLVTQSHRGSRNTLFNLASRWRADFPVDKSCVKLTVHFWAGQAGLKVIFRLLIFRIGLLIFRIGWVP